MNQPPTTPANVIGARIAALKAAGTLTDGAKPTTQPDIMKRIMEHNGGRMFGKTASAPMQQLPFANLTICVIFGDDHKHFLPHLWLSVMPLLEGGAATSIVHTVKGDKEYAEVLNTDEYSTLSRYHYTGIFNYGRAKNIALDCVLTEWVLFLDADERLMLDPDAVTEVLDSEADAAYCKVFSVYQSKPAVAPMTGGDDIILQDDDLAPQVRMFKPNVHRADGRHEVQRYRFSEGTHEQIKPSLVANGATVRDSSVRIFHVGYKNPRVNFIKTMQRLQGLAADLEKNTDISDITTAYRLWMLFGEMDGIEHYRNTVNSLIKPMKGTGRV